MPQSTHQSPRSLLLRPLVSALWAALLCSAALSAHAAGDGHGHGIAASPEATSAGRAPAAAPAQAPTVVVVPPAGKSKSITVSMERDAEKVAESLRTALDRAATRRRAMEQVAAAREAAPATRSAGPVSHAVAHAAAAQGHADIHWDYQGPGGPESWASLKPEFSQCALGKRQSPIHIQDTATLQGPAEALQLDYRPSGGSVVNNGHTIQVDVEPGNTMTVRGRRYELVQFHFHQPAEERINFKSYAMVAHLVHKNAEGGLAVVAVLLDPGAASSLVHKVWTHMPLDSGDRVRLPAGLVDLTELLPKDRNYYQFMGSLTTPPCTEGVLWMVMQQPVTLSQEQLRLFAKLFPEGNARPVQPLHGRVVRQGTSF